MKKIILLIPLLLLVSCGDSYSSIFFDVKPNYDYVAWCSPLIGVQGRVIKWKLFKDEKIEKIVDGLNSLKRQEISIDDYPTYGGTGELYTFFNASDDSFEYKQIKIYNFRYLNPTTKKAYILDEKLTLPEEDSSFYQFASNTESLDTYYINDELICEINNYYNDFYFVESDFTFEAPEIVIQSNLFGTINCYDNKHFTLNNDNVYYELLGTSRFSFPIIEKK